VPGVYIQKADEIRYKEERKIIAGYSSGRKAPEVRRLIIKKKIELFELFLSLWVTIFHGTLTDYIVLYWIPFVATSLQVINDDASSSSGVAGAADHGDSAAAAVAKKEEWILPPKPDIGIVPTVEWWDEPFLSRENREIRKKNVKPIGNNKNSNSNSYSSSSSSGGSNEADASLFVTASLSNARSHM
jgi:hypothetical protein